MPRVSIITPCYNSERFIGRTIESARGQTFTDWEQIVVDDGSADASAHAASAYLASEPRLRVIRQANGGVCRARNAGYAVASPGSAYLLFLDADDCLLPEMLAVLVAYLDARPEVGLVYCDPRYVDADDNPIPPGNGVGFAPRYAPTRWGVRVLPSDCPETPFLSVFTLAGIVPSVSLIRRAVYAGTPGWDEAFGQHCEDTDLFLHFALRSKVHYVPHALVLHRRHGAQSTADLDKLHAQEQKLCAKWRDMAGLSAAERAVVDAALRFREGRFMAFAGWRGARMRLRRGEIGVAARLALGALRRYAASLLYEPPPTPPS